MSISEEMPTGAESPPPAAVPLDEWSKRNLIKLYLDFRWFPWPLVLGGGGLLLLWFTVMAPRTDWFYPRVSNPTMYIVYIVTPVIGVGLILLGARQLRLDGRPSDSQMDAWFEEDVARMLHRSIPGMDESDLIAAPVVIHGPRTSDLGGAKERFRVGADGKVRYTPIDLMIIQFTPHQLVSYRCALDLLTGDARNEEHNEFFYRDIVSMSVRSTTGILRSNKRLTPRRTLVTIGVGSVGSILGAIGLIALKGESWGLGGSLLAGAGYAFWWLYQATHQSQHYREDTFELSTSGTTSIQMTLNDSRITGRTGRDTIPAQQADRALAAIRKMLREKKV